MTGFLASYWYYKRRDLAEAPGPLILDSGAFSAYTQGSAVDLLDYSRWLAHVRSSNTELQWAVNLDVIGNGEFGTTQSFKNWQALRAEHGHLVVPVVHFTSPVPIESQLSPYLAEGAPRVCFGGMVGSVDAVNAWAAHGLRWLRDNAPNVLTHGLGVGPWVKRAQLPWDSTDCSDFGLAYRFGYARLPNPAARKPIDIRLGTGYPPSRTAAGVIRAYGVEPRDTTSDEPAVRCRELARLSFRASEHEEASENARRAAAGIRPVIRYVVDGNVYAEPVIFEEMRRSQSHGRWKPRRIPGIVKPTLGTRPTAR